MTVTPTKPPTPSSTPRRRYGLAIAAALFAVLAVVVVTPDVVRLDRFSPFLQLVAFRPLVAAGAVVLAVALGLLAIRFHWLWPFAAVLAVVAVLAGAITADRVVGEAPPGEVKLTVLSFNTLLGRADPNALAELIRTERPDLIALPEAGQRFRARIAPLVEPLGYRVFTSTSPEEGEVTGTTALVAAHLGDVRLQISRDTQFPYVELTGGGLGRLRFVAIHTAAPLDGSVPRWRDELAVLSRWCAGDTPAIVAGDLNASLDHSALRSAMRGCNDAAAQRGDGLIATWPTSLPRWLGVQIDHVLTTDGINAQSFEVIDLPGSDHRAVLTRLSLP